MIIILARELHSRNDDNKFIAIPSIILFISFAFRDKLYYINGTKALAFYYEFQVDFYSIVL